MDPRTISVLILISGIQCSFLFFVSGVSRRTMAKREYPPSLFWGVGTLVYFFGFLALLTQGKSSLWISTQLSNSLLVLGQCIVILGLRRLVGARIPLRVYALAWFLFSACIAFFTFFVPSTPLRIIVFSCAIAAFYIEGAIHCFRARTTLTGPLTPAMGAVFVVLALFFALRAGITIASPRESVFLALPINVATFLVTHFGLILWCLGLILLQNRETELELERAIVAKDVLFRELQHRVKNSISVISGLVGLEAGRASDPQSGEALNGLQNRIAAIATLYDQLFRAGERGEVELEAYLREVSETLFAGQAAAERGIALELALERVKIDAKRAVPLGLIANELLTDSLKHAFPDGRHGRVRLELHHEARKDGADFGLEGASPAVRSGILEEAPQREILVLEASDDGVGLPTDFAIGDSSGLGLVLVQMLAEQVGGTFEALSGDHEPTAGSRFVVRFPR